MLIYSITNTINNKRYIGQTIHSKEYRWYRHCYMSAYEDEDNHFHRAIQKYGPDVFIIETIEEISDISLLNEREVFWITYFDTFKNGYNSTTGGDNGKILSQEARNKIISTKKGKKFTSEHREKLRQAKLGKPLSEEHKIKIGKKSIGRRHSEETKKKLSERIFTAEWRKKLSDAAKNRSNSQS